MMRRWVFRTCACAAALAVCLGSAALRADDESKPDAGEEAKSVSFEFKNGKLTVTDHHGQKHEFQFGNFGTGGDAVELSGKGLVFIADEDGGTPQAIQLIGKGKGQGEEIDAEIVIVGPDGKSQKLRFGEGKNGEGIVLPGGIQARGKIVVAGPDGKTHEFDLKDAGGVMHGLTLSTDATGGKYMIGLNCEPVGEALREQLKLEQGLLVLSVFDETPAAKAGLKKHDIVLKAGDSAPASIEDLTKAVQKAGEDGQELQLTVLRRGAEQTIAVKPTERKGLMMKFDDLGIDDAKIREQVENALKHGAIDRLMLEKLEPGILGEGARQFLWRSHKRGGDEKQHDHTADLEKKIEELSRQLDELKKAIEAQSANDKKD